MENKRCPVKDWMTDYDIFDPDYVKNPYPVWKDMQARCPVARSERWGGSWMATRYSDLQQLVRMVPELSSKAPAVVPLPKEMAEEAVAELKKHGVTENPPITADPPEHRPYKLLIMPFFTPTAVDVHRPFTRQLCSDLIDRFITTGKADAAEDYAQQIPPRVIARMLGIADDRADEFTDWTRGFLELGQTDPQSRTENRRLIRDFFSELVVERRKRPGEDMISRLIASEINGEALQDYAIIGICMLLLVAGIDTTWSSIGAALWHFSGHEDDRRRLARDPDLFPTAIEEMLRHYSPVMMARKVTAPVAFGDVRFNPDDRVILNFPAANHDSEMFEQPDEVILDRKRNRHLAFGLGIHRCAGSNLARMEMDVALRTWFERIPEFALRCPEDVVWSGGQVRGPRVVPVRFESA